MQDDELAIPRPRKRSKSTSSYSGQRQKIRGMSAGGCECHAQDHQNQDPLTRAITVLEEDEGLSHCELSEAVHYFMKDRDLAMAYLTLTTAPARSCFLRHELENLRKDLST